MEYLQGKIACEIQSENIDLLIYVLLTYNFFTQVKKKKEFKE